MKKLLILSASLLLMTASASFAQTPTTDTAMHHHNGMHKMKDCVAMKGGKMWVMKGGEKSEMTQTMTMTIKNTIIDVSKYLQKLKRASEGIAERDGAGRSAEGTCDLHRPMWGKKTREEIVTYWGARLGAPLSDNLCN